VSLDLILLLGSGKPKSDQNLITAKNLRFQYPIGLPKSAGKKTSAVTTSSTNGGEGRDLAEYGMTYKSPLTLPVVIEVWLRCTTALPLQ
jgi:hypothetical protein